MSSASRLGTKCFAFRVLSRRPAFGVVGFDKNRTGTYVGRTTGGGGNYGGSGGGGSSRSSWPMPTPRPTTSRGGSGGGGGDNVSPMLRPRQGQGFPSHSITPSPTFSAQQGVSPDPSLQEYTTKLFEGGVLARCMCGPRTAPVDSCITIVEGEARKY